jgi:hypothetical protein
VATNTTGGVPDAPAFWKPGCQVAEGCDAGLYGASADWTLVECASSMAYQTWCEDAFELCAPDSCPQGSQDGWETGDVTCNYYAKACLCCTDEGVKVRVFFYNYIEIGCRICSGSGGFSGFGGLWYADYTIAGLPDCEDEEEMTGDNPVPMFPDVCPTDYLNLNEQFFICEDWQDLWQEQDRMCGCALTVTLACANEFP